MNLTDALQAEADALHQTHGGTLGVAATFLPTGESVWLNADTVFPTASVIKVAIVAELMTQVAEGRLDLDTPVMVSPNEIVGGSGVLSVLTMPLTLPLRDLVMLTISESDNTASNRCLQAVGGPSVVNARMRAAWGMTDTTIHRPIKFALEPGDPPATATGTPRDMLALLTRLANGEVHNRETSNAVLELMGHVTDNDLLGRFLEVNPYAGDLRVETPPFILRHKTGAVTGVRNDAAVIERTGEILAVCVYTKKVKDTRWTAAHAGAEVVAQVGKLLADYFWPA